MTNDFAAVCFGEVLWDVLPNAKLPGGAPMNVAYHLNQLKTPAAMISRIGNDEDGKTLQEFIASKNIATHFIQVDEKQPTSKVLAHVNGNHVSYEIVRPVAWDFIEYNIDLQNLVKTAKYFVFGSLASRNNISRQTLFELLEVASFKIFDINIRAPHFEQKTVEYLMQHTDLLKLNEDELELLSGWYNGKGSELDKLKHIQDKFQIDTVLVTKGDKGAAALHEGQYVVHNGYKVTVADTIGSGDAFLAGFISSFFETENVEQTLDFACKMGAFIASFNGACPAYLESDVKNNTFE